MNKLGHRGWGWVVGVSLMMALLFTSQADARPRTEPERVPQGPQHGVVAEVVDGDTLRLTDGRTLRLLDINTPELAHYGNPEEPLAGAATAYLRQLVEGKPVVWQAYAKPVDKYGRTLAHVFVRDRKGEAGWVNGALVLWGLARVYTFADNAQFGQELLPYEDQARAAKRGVWGRPETQLQAADACCAASLVSNFGVVEGVVTDVRAAKGSGGGRVYLNFGPDWRTDFSVEIQVRDKKHFGFAGRKWARMTADELAAELRDRYMGRRVQVRGVLRPVNGVLVRATHPLQVRVVR